MNGPYVPEGVHDHVHYARFAYLPLRTAFNADYYRRQHQWTVRRGFAPAGSIHPFTLNRSMFRANLRRFVHQWRRQVKARILAKRQLRRSFYHYPTFKIRRLY